MFEVDGETKYSCDVGQDEVWMIYGWNMAHEKDGVIVVGCSEVMEH